MGLEILGQEMERADDPRRAATGAGQRPVRCGRRERPEARLDRLHGLAHDPVGEDHHRGAVAFGDLEGGRDQLDRLGDRGWGQYRHPVVAVAVALGGLEVVALRGLDAAQARARRASR